VAVRQPRNSGRGHYNSSSGRIKRFKGSATNGATDGATLQSRKQWIRMNTRSAADWEVMIEQMS